MRPSGIPGQAQKTGLYRIYSERQEKVVIARTPHLTRGTK